MKTSIEYITKKTTVENLCKKHAFLSQITNKTPQQIIDLLIKIDFTPENLLYRTLEKRNSVSLRFSTGTYLYFNEISSAAKITIDNMEFILVYFYPFETENENGVYTIQRSNLYYIERGKK